MKKATISRIVQKALVQNAGPTKLRLTSSPTVKKGKEIGQPKEYVAHFANEQLKFRVVTQACLTSRTNLPTSAQLSNINTSLNLVDYLTNPSTFAIGEAHNPFNHRDTVKEMFKKNKLPLNMHLAPSGTPLPKRASLPQVKRKRPQEKRT